MRKKKLVYSILASALIAGCLASCNNTNTSSGTSTTPATEASSTSQAPGTSGLATTPQSETSSTPASSSEATSTSTSTQAPVFKLEDNLLTQKVYNEFIKLFPNIDYTDFLVNGDIDEVNNFISFKYNGSFVTLRADGSLYGADVFIKDENDKLLSWSSYHFINNEIVKTNEYVYINGKQLVKYRLNIGDNDTFEDKYEYTYDNNGNLLSKLYSIYEEDKWVYNANTEYTYDDNGNALTCTETKFVNNNWVVLGRSKYINNSRKYIYSLYLNRDGSFNLKHENTYDDNGNLLIEVHSNYVNNDWEYDYKYEYTYDSNNNLLLEVLSEFIDGNWVPIEKEENTYNSNNNQITKIYSQFINGEWAFLTKYEYEYDENDNRITQIKSDFTNGAWVLNEKEENTFDEYGNDLTSMKSKYIDDVWVKVQECKVIGNLEYETYSLFFNQDGSFSSLCEYTYDENGNVLTDKRYVYINGSWILEEENKYINGNKKIIYRVTFNDDGSLKEKGIHTYDSNGNLLTSAGYKYIDNDWVKSVGFVFINGVSYNTYLLDFNDDGSFNQIKEYTYDDNGNKTSESTTKYINGEWIKISTVIFINGNEYTTYSVGFTNRGALRDKIESTYDEYGKKILEIRSIIKGGTWTYSDKYEYTYDDNGNLISEIHYDPLDGGWVYKTKTESTYDSNGIGTSWVLSNYLNGNWVYVQKSDYSFDEYGNILQTDSKFLNDKWEKITESIFINGTRKKTFEIILNQDNTFYSLNETTYDASGNKKTYRYSIYQNGEWVKYYESVFINGNELYTYDLTFDTIKEATYDEEGNILTYKESKYINNEWIKLLEKKRINNILKILYQVDFDLGGSISSKNEYTYDDNGNELSDILSYYENDEWVYNSKTEYTYDENNNKQTHTYSEFINGEWLVVRDAICINGEQKYTLEISLSMYKDILSKNEYTYDENGNELTEVFSRYINDSFVYEEKREHTYKDNGDVLTEIYSEFRDGAWVKMQECKYINGNCIDIYVIGTNENNEFEDKYERTINDNGDTLVYLYSEYVNNTWVDTYKNEFEYDSNNNISLERTLMFINGAWDKTYEYIVINGQDLTTCETSTNLQGEYTDKYEYTYDENGNLLTTTHYIYDNGNWVVQ